MNEIKLLKMTLRNFKGIKEFTLNTNGLNALVFGENATGKTTLYDAFLWNLFNKDSANRADFSVKPQDKNGNDINFLETEVTLYLLINGKAKTLRKILEEVWTKKRGESNKEFTGHQTSYWIDDVPVKKKEFMDQINTIIDENVFKLLTNPFFFCTQIKWEERRKTLMDICGDITDADVIDSVVTVSDKSMLDLLNIINTGRTISQHKTVIADRIRKLNKQIDEIPIKINELSRTLLGEDVNYSVVEDNLIVQKAALRKVEQSLTDASQMASIYRQKQQDIFKLSSAMDERKKELDEGAMAGLKRAMDEKAKLEGEKYQRTTLLKSTERKLESIEKQISENDADLVSLRTAWGTENEKQFVEPDHNSFICPTCEQSLPSDQKESKIAQMRSNFETTKAQDMAKINTAGKDIKARQEALKSEREVLNNDLMNHELNLRDINDRLAELTKEVDAERSRTFGANYDTDPKYSDLNTQLQEIKAELSKPVNDTTADLIKQKNFATEQINLLNKVLNNREVAMKTAERIEELKAEEKTLAAQLSEFEKQKFLIERFVKAKVNLLEETINSRFKLVKWKLFKTNINGGIEEMCEAMVGGVEFNSNLNHAARVNAGLDIINVLAGHYGCSAPIFIDFRESVSRIIETGSQVINLVKSEADKALRVEVA